MRVLRGVEVSFTETVRTYEFARRATATRETLTSPLVRRLAGEIRRLSHALRDLDDDELWTAVIRRLRRSFRELGSTPLAPGSAVFGLTASAEYLRTLVSQAQGNYADDLVARAALCVSALEDLSTETANPFGDLVVEILSTGDLRQSALLVKTRYLDEVARWLASAAPSVRLVTESEVTWLTATESLVVAGPSYWFPNHVLTAPRAETICFVHYDAMRDQRRPVQLFSGSHRSPGTEIRSAAVTEPRGDDEVDADLLVPTVDWDALTRVSGGRRRSADDVDDVPANLFLLADGHAVYLEAGDGPTIDVVVDLEPGATPRLRSERTRAIGTGDYIVLRSEGGSGDYIPGIADALLGKRAATLRASQARWKKALRETVRAKGFSRVERDLRSLGVTSPNLRYRMWRNSLRSRDPNDFRILLEYIGVGDEAAALWTAMGEIFEAHLRAGQDVRKLLEKAVLATDPEELVQRGRVDVGLVEMDAGTLSVVRVEARSPETVAVDEDDLRVMTEVEPDLWQG